MIDLGAKIDINAIRIAWANPYAKRYYAQLWTGDVEPLYEGINKGTWQTFPMGTVSNGQGETPTLRLVDWKIPARYLHVWMTESSNTCDTHGPQDNATVWDMPSMTTLGPYRSMDNSMTSSNTCRAGNRPSLGLLR